MLSKAEFVAKVKATLPDVSTDAAERILERIRTVLDADDFNRSSNIPYIDRFKLLYTLLSNAYDEDPDSVEVELVAAIEHLLHCAMNTGWLLGHLDLHHELHTLENLFGITRSNTDAGSQNAEQAYLSMKKSTELLNVLIRSGIKVDLEELHLELDPSQLEIRYDKLLGGGGFAKLHKSDLTEDERATILAREARREVAMLYNSQPSPHMISVYGLCMKDNKPCVVMEPAEMSLASKLAKSRNLTWWDKMVLLRDIALALDYMHSCQLIHRDLKSANILICKNGRARIADVGGAASTASVAYRPAAYTPGYAPSIPHQRSAATSTRLAKSLKISLKVLYRLHCR
ncbi:hypothetical protein HDV00_010127 [Rhizophlyctis rosea]|nr:hypothetical protein HDV00_010127 [Rhizophlyctis rosea]